MSKTSMVHARIDDDLKTVAAENLAKVGLTISDAIRILLTRVAKQGSLPAELAIDNNAYDLWFRAKVQEALNDHSPFVSFEQVMEECEDLIDKKNLQ